MRKLIDLGYVYIAQPPLFRIKHGKTEQYVYSDEEKDRHLQELGDKKNIAVQRYKGLGEMNPDQLSDTTMNPETRRLLQVKMEDFVEADRVFSMLMGEDVASRRKYIEDNAYKVQNLDI